MFSLRFGEGGCRALCLARSSRLLTLSISNDLSMNNAGDYPAEVLVVTYLALIPLATTFDGIEKILLDNQAEPLAHQ